MVYKDQISICFVERNMQFNKNLTNSIPSRNILNVDCKKDNLNAIKRLKRLKNPFKFVSNNYS